MAVVYTVKHRGRSYRTAEPRVLRGLLERRTSLERCIESHRREYVGNRKRMNELLQYLAARESKLADLERELQVVLEKPK